MGVAWTPDKLFSLTAQAYVGKDPTFDAQKTLVDAVATYNATDALTFILSYDWGRQQQHAAGRPDLGWNGAAFYTNYALSDQWRVSLRVEYLDDKDGFVTATDVAKSSKKELSRLATIRSRVSSCASRPAMTSQPGQASSDRSAKQIQARLPTARPALRCKACTSSRSR